MDMSKDTGYFVILWALYLFKVYNKASRETTSMSFWCLCVCLWIGIAYRCLSVAFMVDFEITAYRYDLLTTVNLSNRNQSIDLFCKSVHWLDEKNVSYVLS